MGVPAMNTQKIAITIPMDLVLIIDEISKQQGISRSRFISEILREKMMKDRDQRIKEAYDRIFSDKSICKEQLDTAAGFEAFGNIEGQEW
jgi:metal-responsive CopG/Arc/MetJ family transcriptional regulator